MIAGLALVCVILGTSAAPASARGPWQRIFSDDFEHGLELRHWAAYSGQPGGDPEGWWDPSHVSVSGGMLHLTSYQDANFAGRWVSGGVSNAPGLVQTYGRYTVRLRVDRGYGVSAVALLWPHDEAWPPEIDFAEDDGVRGVRNAMDATLHYGPDNAQIGRTVHADFTRWHVMGVAWTPGRLVYTLDGRPWATVRSRAVPSKPMELDLQASTGTCGDRFQPCPDATTPARVDFQVDWVRIDRYRPGRSGTR